MEAENDSCQVRMFLFLFRILQGFQAFSVRFFGGVSGHNPQQHPQAKPHRVNPFHEYMSIIISRVSTIN